ncbi:MAG: mercuric reductase [Candidatus Binatus sp.]|uniref:mercuric reductase n=1 Tax=Candidatus Binatus sp. TaxID=2811406 RepID=UPI00272355B3|nr:mercuric reductase [Candidatus Binatus sp.]MDO8431713.1 mercuric reductase [Candidatus Binatus sp.]
MPTHALAHAPLDEYNRALVENLHPAGWVNPAPAHRYNLVVIGAGTAGLVTAAGGAILGAKVALVERDYMGGDCLNFGCVPSKALIRAARAAAEVRNASRFGVEVPAGVRVNFPAVMERMRKLRAKLSPIDSANRFRGLGVDVFIGDGKFGAPDCVEVEGKQLRFKKAVIATGARAASLPIRGLAETGYLTNETVFSLTELPRRIAVIGAGPIGCELAQTFQRLGAAVTLLEVAPQILIREDRDAANRVERAMTRDGVAIVTGCKIVSVERRGTEKVVSTERDGARTEYSVDEILIGVGRVPAVEGLNLEAAMIQYDAQNGIKVDDYLRTTNPLVYAAGDVASPYKFTHLSDAHARIVLRNALFFGRQRVSALTIPWCTYTDPEIAHVGLHEAEAKSRGIAITTYSQELAEVDRAVLDGETDGFVKVHVREGSDTIVGATIVASHAGEMISELTTAIAAGVGLGKIADVIHPYPTQADAIRRAGALYNRTRLTPFVAGLMKRWFALTR